MIAIYSADLHAKATDSSGLDATVLLSVASKVKSNLFIFSISEKPTDLPGGPRNANNK